VLERLGRWWRMWARQRAVLAGRTRLHTGRREGQPGIAYRAWFRDPAHLERLAGPITSFAWSVEATAVLVAPGAEGAEAHYLLTPLTPAEISAFRKRYAPSRDALGAAERRPRGLAWVERLRP
jgi:hypothetical protein